jgi:hypothetical protein
VRRSSRRLAASLACATSLAACVRAPSVVIVDRKTALEQQAAGSFRGLEEELARAGQSPRPTPLTSEQLAAAGVADDEDAREAALEDEVPGNDALRTDGLLVQRCIGEALDGTLVLTIDPCTGTIDVPEVNRLIERVNRERRQLWRWLEEHAGGKSALEVRAAWREIHLAGLICGAQLQRAGTTWEIKAC